MTNNCGRRWSAWACLGLGLVACREPETNPGELQGVAELEERRLGFEVSGRIVTLRVREGDRIKAGDVLATLDGALDAQARATGALEAQAARAQADLIERGTRAEAIAQTRARLRAAESAERLAHKQLERERGLFERGVTPRATLDELEARAARAEADRMALESLLAEQERGARPEEREAARARAEAARASVVLDELRLERRELVAPLEAEVLDVLAEPGEVVLAGAPVLAVADPSSLYAEVFVPQSELPGIDVGDEARVRADGLERPLAGKVEHIARRTEFTPRYLFSERERGNLVVRVKVRIEDPTRVLHAGVPVFVQIERDVPAMARTEAP